MEDILVDFPAITPGRITWRDLHAIADWRHRHGIGTLGESLLIDDYRDEGYRATEAGLELGLIDYGQATGRCD